MNNKVEKLPTSEVFESLFDPTERWVDTWKVMVEESSEPKLTALYTLKQVAYQYHCTNDVDELDYFKKYYNRLAIKRIQELSEMCKLDNPLTTISSYPIDQNRLFGESGSRSFFSCSCGFVGHQQDLIEHFEIQKHSDEYMRYFVSTSCPRCYTRHELREHGYSSIVVQDMKKLLTLYACNDEYDNSQGFNMYRMLNQTVIENHYNK